MPCAMPVGNMPCAPSAYYRRAADNSTRPSEKLEEQRFLALKQSEIGSGYLTMLAEFSALEQQLLKVASYHAGWDSYDAEAPSSATVRSTKWLLKRMRQLGFVPSSVVASAEGGIAIYFFRSEKTAYVEYRNSGEALAAMYDRETLPVVIELDATEASSLEAITRIREYLAT
jgi:hypothetical protein